MSKKLGWVVVCAALLVPGTVFAGGAQALIAAPVKSGEAKFDAKLKELDAKLAAMLQR